MAVLVIPDLDNALYDELRRRAENHHRSLADEAHETLRQAVVTSGFAPLRPDGPGTSLIDLARELFGPGGLELDLPPRHLDTERLPPDFSGPDYDR